MENKETTQWQNEIARLNSIIDALIAENRQLKAEIAFLKKQKGISDAAIPYDKVHDDIINEAIPYDNIMKGSSSAEIPYDKNKAGIGTEDNPDDKVKQGNGSDSIPYDKINVGNVNADNPHDNVMKGISNAANPYDNNKEGNSNVRIGNGEKLQPGPQHQRILAKHLDKVLHVRTPKSGKRHAATLLLYFYNSNRGAHNELRKVTGLSLGGLTKQLALFKKRGWLVKDGWQQFKLTDMARKIVEDGVRGNTPPTS
jgi:hypothetical protein